jgi:uncharacterized membrane protein
MRYDDPDRIERLERRLEDLGRRVERLETVLAPPAAAPQAPPPRPPEPRPMRPIPDQAPRRPAPAGPSWSAVDLEELLGGRVLGWLGGSAIVLGAVFFLVMAVSRGWIDEPTRVVLAFLGSTVLLAAGLYLYERQGQTQAALAAVAAAIAALYASDTAATQLYDLIDPALGLGVAGLIGVTATAIAVRWSSPIVAGIGIVGALLAPVLVDAGTSGVTLAFMALALASSTAVLLWQRWDWLAAVSFVVSVPQLAAWVSDTYEEDLWLTLVVLSLFWGVYVAAAIGYELRVPIAQLRASSAMLLLAAAVLIAGAGWLVLDDTGHEQGGTAWVLGLALVHVVLGAGGYRGRVSDEIGALLIAVAIGLSAIGLGLALSGPALVVGWSVEAVLLAWISGRTRDRRAELGVGLFLGLAAAHLLAFEAPPTALLIGVDSLAEAGIGIAVLGVAALAASRLIAPEPRERVIALQILGAVAAVYLPSIAIVDAGTTGDLSDPGQTPQLLLSAFWSATGLAAIVFGLVRDERAARFAGLGLLGLAAAKVFLFDLAELDSIYRVLSFVALGLLLLAGAFAYQRIRHTVGEVEQE